MKFRKFLAFGFVLVMVSCKNELKLNAPYKEFPSIYAVLNPKDSVHMIRINKVFLGEGDAAQMAKIADSVNYPQGELTVTLTRFENDIQLNASRRNKVVEFKDSVITTREGQFSTSQRVYVSYDTLFDHNGRIFGKYILTVKNNRTGNVFTASAFGFDAVNLNGAVWPLSPPYYPYLPTNSNRNDFIDYSSLQKDPPYEVKFTPNSDNIAKVFRLTIRLHFYDSLFTGQKIYRYVDYSGTNQQQKDVRYISQVPFLVTYFKGEDIFAGAGAELRKMGLSNSNITGRKMYKIEYVINSSTQEYYDYLQYSAPSFNIAQQKPLYSNFDNKTALGIFTFRNRVSVSKEIATTFVNEFSDNPHTCGYDFFTSDLELLECN